MEINRKINLTGILIEDPNVGGFTAFFAESPEAIAEGETVEEAVNNLFDAFRFIQGIKAEETLSGYDPKNIISRNFELELNP